MEKKKKLNELHWFINANNTTNKLQILWIRPDEPQFVSLTEEISMKTNAIWQEMYV